MNRTAVRPEELVLVVALAVLTTVQPTAEATPIADQPTVSAYFSDALIRRAAYECCDADMSDCCLERLRNDSRITCGSDARRQLQAAACVERVLHNDSIIEIGAHECCWLLSSESCQRKCSRELRRPTLPFEEKFTFTDDCPRLAPAEQRRVWYAEMREQGLLTAADDETAASGQFDCLWQTKYKLHDCFSTCLAWQRKNRNVSVPLGNNRADAEENQFNPKRHCDDYRLFVEENPCMFIVGEA